MFFFFNDTATTEIYTYVHTLSLHDALPIWAQTGGKGDGFICAVGTGGILAGVSAYLKQRNPSLVTAAADPDGAAIYSWVKTGELTSQGSSITEGIGQNRKIGRASCRERVCQYV